MKPPQAEMDFRTLVLEHFFECRASLRLCYWHSMSIIHMLFSLSHTQRARTIRRFRQDPPVTEADCRALIDLGRCTPNAMNAQSTSFKIVTGGMAKEIFPEVKWAGALKDWNPRAEEAPTAWILLCGPNKWDMGIIAQTINLGARAAGIGCCMIASFNKKNIQSIVGPINVGLVLALGIPDEEPILDALQEGQTLSYWRDDQGRHHVPKRSLDNVIIE